MANPSPIRANSPAGAQTEEAVVHLIDRLLKEKDPATVGLRRILKNKQAETDAYQYHALPLNDIGASANGNGFTQQEQRVIELEKQLLLQRRTIQNLKDKTATAVTASFEQGKIAGFKLGEVAGKNAAALGADQQLERLQQKTAVVIETMMAERRSAYREAEHDMVKLSLALARKVINTEVQANPEIILNIVKKSLSYIAERERLIIRVSPADYSLVDQKRDFWLPVNERLKDVIIETDDRIESGGCIIESGSGAVDARLSVQLKELEAILENTWEHASGLKVDHA